MRQLEQAKKALPDVYLLVGVTGDKETHKRKGLTVLSGQERAETVRHCKWVDEVIEDCPWIVTPEFLEEKKIDYVAHDDLPYGADEGDDIYKPIKEAGKGKELRQFWQASRPGSPARMSSYDESNKNGPLTSPSTLSHLSRRLEIQRADSPGPGSDFATGYSLGLIGGVRSWVSHFIFQGIRSHTDEIFR